MSIIDSEKHNTSLLTLSNAAELAANISMQVLNECFYSSEKESPTMDVVREACIERIKSNHGLA
jgi:hypothetical protein